MRAVIRRAGRASRRDHWIPLLSLAAGLALLACSGPDSNPQDTSNPPAAPQTPASGSGPALSLSAGGMQDPDCDDVPKSRADSNAGSMAAVTDTAIRNSLRRDCLRRSRAVAMAAIAMKATGQMMWSIPEYHDEQAFPLSANEFGPVALIFASPFLGGFRRLWQVEEQGTRGMVAAVVVVVATADPLPDPYVRLKLKAGANCLWLARISGAWKAYISQPKPDSACVESDPRAELAVIASQHPQHPREEDYPPVARFSEAGNPANGDPYPIPGAGQPLLGTRCVDRWCEIGPMATNGSPDFALSNPGGDDTGKEDRIKGWHDEQWLAVEAGTTGKLVPGFRAVVIPEPNIATRSAADFKGTNWRRVAKVKLFADPPPGSKYALMGFRDKMNEIEIRNSTNGWEARLKTSAGVTTPLKLFDRVQHYDAAVPGTARFRWNLKDDGVWAPCGQACCRIASII